MTGNYTIICGCLLPMTHSFIWIYCDWSCSLDFDLSGEWPRACVYVCVTGWGLKVSDRSEVSELKKCQSVKFSEGLELEMKMMFVRFALGVHGARAATRSSTRALGHGHARSLCSDTGLFTCISLCVENKQV